MFERYRQSSINTKPTETSFLTSSTQETLISWSQENGFIPQVVSRDKYDELVKKNNDVYKTDEASNTKTLFIPDDLTPNEVYTYIFEEGQKRLKDILVSDFQRQEQPNGPKTLYEALRIPELKDELTQVKLTGNLSLISEEEIKISQIIQEAVSKYPYKDYPYNSINKMRQYRHLNSLGYSMLGTQLLKELGINCLTAISKDNHAAIVLITSDKRAYWQDFSNRYLSENNLPITPNMLVNNVDIPSISTSQRSVKIKFNHFNPYNHTPGLTVYLSRPNIGLLAESLHNNSRMLADLNLNEKAIIIAQMAEEIDPANALRQIELSRLLLHSSRNNEAIKHALKAVEIDSDNALYHQHLSDIYFSFDRYEKAISEIKKSIQLDPKETKFYASLINILYYTNRYEEAIKWSKQDIINNPSNSLSYYNLGDILFDCKRYKEALGYYRQALNLDHTNASYNFKLGDTLFNLKKYEEALGYYQQALSRDQKNAIYHYALGKCYHYINKDYSAINSYLNAIELKPNHVEAVYDLADIQVSRGKYEEAIAVYKNLANLYYEDSSINLQEIRKRIEFVKNIARCKLYHRMISIRKL